MTLFHLLAASVLGTSLSLFFTRPASAAARARHHPCQWPSFIPRWDESARAISCQRTLHSPRWQFYQHTRNLHDCGGGGGGRVLGRCLNILMADNTASRQEACTSSPFTYTRLDGDNSDISAIFTGQRDIQHVLQVMEKAAYLAGDIARATSGRIAVQMTKANERDLVTQSDLQCQRLIREVLSKEFPTDLFLGEEEEGEGGLTDTTITVPSSDALLNSLNSISQLDGGKEDRLLFVVDPIDGTTNFQAGLPIYAISIGAVSLPPLRKGEEDGVGGRSNPEVVVGVIYNPALNEMMSAVRGRGCYLNHERIRPRLAVVTASPMDEMVDYDNGKRHQSILSQSLINVGYPIKSPSTLEVSARAISALSTQVRGLRIMACASQTIAWVAQSKFDAYIGWDLNAWDVAAGLVIVEESGGHVCNFDGSRADIMSRDMIITCGSCRRCSEEFEDDDDRILIDELIQVLKDHNCMEY